MTDYTQIKLEKDGPIATLTLHRPDKMNAFTGTMMDELIAAVDETDADDDVRAVIVTGHGDRAFCAGADLTPEDGAAPFASKAPVDDLSDPIVRDGGGKVTLRLFNSKKPLIAAVNGVAVGVGVTMQLPMDIRLASTSARFGFVFARRGIVPEAASSWFLPRLVGPQRALEWCMTGRVFGAEEALEGGLVRSLHEPGELMDAAHALAKRDRGEHLGRLGGDDARYAVAPVGRRAPDGSPPGRQPRDLYHGQGQGRRRGGGKLPRKARSAVPGDCQ